MANRTVRVSSGGGCLSLVLFIAVFAALIGAWFWSEGMDPQSAAALGLEYSTKITGFMCGGICTIIAVITGLMLAAAISRN